MTVIYLLIGISLLVASGFLVAFLWAVKSGQYEDQYTPSVRILFEDNRQADAENSTKKIRDKKNEGIG